MATSTDIAPASDVLADISARAQATHRSYKPYDLTKPLEARRAEQAQSMFHSGYVQATWSDFQETYLPASCAPCSKRNPDRKGKKKATDLTVKVPDVKLNLTHLRARDGPDANDETLAYPDIVSASPSMFYMTC